MVSKMGVTSKGYVIPTTLIFLVILLHTVNDCAYAEANYEIDFQDPAGDVLEFNETWHEKETVDSQPQIDIKWLRSANDTLGNVVLRMEFRNHQTIEIANETIYAFRIFTSSDNSTGYNITYQNGSAVISNFNHTLEENITSNISIVYDKGEVLLVHISKNRYLSNITHFNIDAYTWKEQQNSTYIDYVSEIPGHPGATGTVLEEDGGDSEDDSDILGLLCTIQFILIAVVILVIIIIIVIIAKR
jgi:hypothetical protein